jgi:hypothetical protein
VVDRDKPEAMMIGSGIGMITRLREMANLEEDSPQINAD